MPQTTSRRRARELVLKRLYATEIGEIAPVDIEEYVADDDKLSEKHQNFARDYYRLVLLHEQWADEIISRLAVNWKIERIAVIDRTILRMGLIELTHMPDIPVRVVIDEAIELDKKYSTGNSSAFVNGLLEHYAGELEIEKKDQTAQ